MYMGLGAILNDVLAGCENGLTSEAVLTIIRLFEM